MLKIEKNPIETDFLIVGGGIAGLMAAINAAGQGIQVMVAEKANTKRSGSGATGNDHFMCYIPEVHGDDIDPIINEVTDSLGGKFQDKKIVSLHLRESFDRVKDWESWGIPMKPHGQWEFTGHSFPGRPRIWLKYEGAQQKITLTREAKRRGAQIENRLSITEVITKGEEVIGAIGIDTAGYEPVIKVFRTKSILLATGATSRLYPAQSPGWMFNTAFSPSCTGNGRAMAYRAGAKLVNMEIPYTHAGPKYFARCGKATWIGVLKDPFGNPVGPFVQKPTKELCDITADVWNSVFTEMHQSGKGPVYMDCTNTAEEDIQYMLWGLKNEGNTAMLNYMGEEEIDIRKRKVEFVQYEPILCGRGIQIDEKAETNIKGLYAAGDEVGNFAGFIGGAATIGWIAGHSAVGRTMGVKNFQKAEESLIVMEKAHIYSDLLSRTPGPSWQEANLAIQQIMNDYAGISVRSETLLKAGYQYLTNLKAKIYGTLKAENSHELMRCLEVLDLLDCGEAVFLAALERKETRGLHKRADFTYSNPLLEKEFITVQKQNKQTKIEWRSRV